MVLFYEKEDCVSYNTSSVPKSTEQFPTVTKKPYGIRKGNAISIRTFLQRCLFTLELQVGM